MQLIAWQLTVLLVAALAAIFLFVRARAGEPADYQVVQARAYRWRGALFWLLTVVGVPVAAITLWDLPYVRAGDPVTPQVVTVTAHQWYWEMDRERVFAGQPVEFRVSGIDVNHGMGIYDSGLRLVAQTQAMPGYVNRLRYTFRDPGIYRILCLEYCGLAHHDMIAELKVMSP